MLLTSGLILAAVCAYVVFPGQDNSIAVLKQLLAPDAVPLETVSRAASSEPPKSGAPVTQPNAPDPSQSMVAAASGDVAWVGEEIHACVAAAQSRIKSDTYAPLPAIPSRSAIDWERLASMTTNANGTAPAALVAAVCGAHASASDEDLRASGIESIALAQIEQAAMGAVREKEQHQQPVLQDTPPVTRRSMLEDYARKLPPEGMLLAVIAILGLLMAMFLVIILRVTALHRKLTLIYRSVRYGTLSNQDSVTRRALNSAKELAEQGVYVAAADVELDQHPKVIVLTLANAMQLPQKATVHFSFFNADEQKVGDHRTAPVTVPAEGIYNLRTPVPANDGSWVKWRSEIRPAI